MAPQRASRIEAWRAIWAMCAAERAIMGHLGSTSCRGGALCFIKNYIMPWRYLVSQVLWIKDHIVPWRYLVLRGIVLYGLHIVPWRLGAVESPSTPSEPHQVFELDAVSEESK
ncbi:hypothetical protein JOM56_004439 [Amanita muscaria]